MDDSSNGRAVALYPADPGSNLFGLFLNFTFGIMRGPNKLLKLEIPAPAPYEITL